MRPSLSWLVVCGCNPWRIENNLVGDPVSPTEPTASTDPTVVVPDPLDLPGAGAVPVNQRCMNLCPSDRAAWDAVVEWSTMIDSDRVASMPAVAHLDDEDGDGVIGSSGDHPEVMVASGDGTTGLLRGWRGDGTSAFGNFPSGLQGFPQGVAVGDLNGDRVPELVVDADHRLTAFEPDGTVLWTSAEFTVGDPTSSNGCTPVLRDLESDGAPEVFCGAILVDGATGVTRARFELGGATFFTTTIADLDLDGVAEIVAGRGVFRSDGSLWWTATPSGSAAFPAAVQLDADPEGEVVIASDGSLSAWDTDGTFLWSTIVNTTERAASSPCVADFDGDGQMEIAAAFAFDLAMFESDGTLVWTVPITDETTAAGCAAFDFDLDGRAEIAYADEIDFSLFCGADGKRLYTDPDHQSVTVTEYPVVVDLDGDGSAEVVVSRSGGPAGFAVYGHRDHAWPATGRVWPQPDYDQTDPGALDGTTASWLAGVGVHAAAAEGPVTPVDPELLVEMGVELHDQAGDCDGLSLAVRVWNSGTRDAPEGRSLEVWAVDSYLLGHPTERQVRTVTLPAVPSGVTLAALQIDLGPDELGAWGLHLRLPADPTTPSCETGETGDQDLMIPFPCDR